ncbi:HalOD1 output domain-containing protein [Halobellus ordinarius]|uniref:HalOD1 output domain-containing protein n=1 Tax=Halobellus ordinarius TaxID=3075120 RepID=UPI002880BA73|nr:HalOD1 output domain-containing protein [Halobellus sp. ZY16]
MTEKGWRSFDRPDIEINRDEQVRVFRADDPEQGVSTDIVLAVAELSGSDPTELRPLNDVIDADALDSLFSRKHPGSENDRVSFNYQGYRVTVYRDGEIMLQPRGGIDAKIEDNSVDC